jgi:uncharacterized protein YggE
MKKIFLTILTFLFIMQLSAQRSANQLDFKNKREAKEEYNEPSYNEGSYDKNVTRGYNNQLATTTWAQTGLEKNELNIQCQVLMNVKADSYLAIFNLTQVGQTAKEADELISKRTAPFIEGLKNMGIQASDIYVDMVYLIPMYEFEVEKKLFSKTYNEMPNGFEMQKNLHIRFKKSDMIDDIVALSAANEIYDLVTIEYFVKDAQAVYDTMSNKAVQHILKNVAKYEKLGLKVEGEFRIIYERKKAIYPESQYTNYESFVSQSLDAAKNKTVTTMRKPKTVAYNKLPYENFDIVVNPEFLEPVVQYTYKLQVRYLLNKDKLEPKNKYFIIDQNGNLKEVPIKDSVPTY